MGEVVEVPCFGFDGVESLFDVGAAGVDGGDAGFGVGDSPVGGLGSACGAVAVAEAGVHGVVVGFPHGRAQLRAQLVFDLGDAVGVGLPGGPGGGERRLQVGELGGGLGAPVGSVGRGRRRDRRGAARAGPASGRPSPGTIDAGSRTGSGAAGSGGRGRGVG